MQPKQIMNITLEKTKQVQYFTNMRLVTNALGIKVQDYDWYLSDIETIGYVFDFDNIDQWVSGEQLASILNNHEIQFEWAVFSAVPKGFRAEVVDPPYADGNPTFWNCPDLLPQLPGALFEIVCWDSSATLLVGLNKVQTEKFCNFFSDAKELKSPVNHLN